MIVAVADYVEGKIDNPPLILRYALQAKSYNTLPNSGGLRSQPAGMMLKMSAAINVYNAFKSFKSNEFNVKWIKANPELWEIITEVETLRGKIEEQVSN